MEKEDESTVTQFQTLLPLMLECISAALNQRSENEAQKALEMFVELAEIEPGFFKPSLPTVIGAMMQIAQATTLQDETRRYGLEVLLTLCEVKPLMMKFRQCLSMSSISLLTLVRVRAYIIESSQSL